MLAPSNKVQRLLGLLYGEGKGIADIPAGVSTAQSANGLRVINATLGRFAQRSAANMRLWSDEPLSGIGPELKGCRKTFYRYSVHPVDANIVRGAGSLETRCRHLSIVENVAHLRDLELEATTVRIRRILTESNPRTENFDGAAIVAAERYNDECITDALSAFALGRKRNVNRLAPDQLNRVASFAGKLATLCDVLEKLRAHDEEHCAAIEKARRAGDSERLEI